MDEKKLRALSSSRILYTVERAMFSSLAIAVAPLPSCLRESTALRAMVRLRPNLTPLSFAAGLAFVGTLQYSAPFGLRTTISMTKWWSSTGG